LTVKPEVPATSAAEHIAPLATISTEIAGNELKHEVARDWALNDL